MTVQDIGKFMTYYYMHPEPNRIPEVVKSIASSQDIANCERLDEHGMNLMAYTFVRGADPNKSIRMYEKLFTESKGKSRALILTILQLGGDEATRVFLQNQLKAAHTKKSKDAIKAALDRGIGNMPKPLEYQPSDPDHLDLLWAEFFVTGNPKAVVYIINAACSDESDPDAGRFDLTSGAAKWSLNSNAKQHEKVLSICESELKKRKLSRSRFLLSMIIGSAYSGKHESGKALGYLKQACEINPDDAQIHAELAKVYEQQGDTKSAESENKEYRRIKNKEESGLKADMSSGKLTPELEDSKMVSELKTEIDKMIQLLESGKQREFFERYCSPDNVLQAKEEGLFEKTVRDMQGESGKEILKYLKVIKNKSPEISRNVASFKIPDLQRKAKFEKIDSRWYLID
jgi:tetratricopeptide (TPR) repeat protein